MLISLILAIRLEFKIFRRLIRVTLSCGSVESWKIFKEKSSCSDFYHVLRISRI